MYLEMDMGNSRIKWRVRKDSTILVREALRTGSDFAMLEPALSPYKNALSGIWVASVAGDELEKKLSVWAEDFFGLRPVFVRSDRCVGIVKNGYESPSQLGVDRWLGLLGAYRSLYCACIVVSCGTAITVDLLSQEGRHQGGYIAPGLTSMLNTIKATTRLVQVDATQFSMILCPGRTTENAVFAGITGMLVGVIENALKQLSVHGYAKIEIILTGGDAAQLLPFYPHAHLIPDLILDGMVCVMESSFPEGQ